MLLAQTVQVTAQNLLLPRTYCCPELTAAQNLLLPRTSFWNLTAQNLLLPLQNVGNRPSERNPVMAIEFVNGKAFSARGALGPDGPCISITLKEKR
jgi:hypothetical protein